jgi:dihydrofolate reductase
MRKILAFEVTTLDGYYEGPNGEFDWPVVDAEFEQFATEQLDEVDALLFGRVTYEGMASYWPTPMAKEQNDPRITAKMNGLPKLVASRTLDRADWAETRILRGDLAAEVASLKEQPGRGIAIFGSPALVVSLLKMGLVDEVRVMVNPVVLGAGKSLFRTADERIALKLLGTRRFASGNVLLTYEPAAR